MPNCPRIGDTTDWEIELGLLPNTRFGNKFFPGWDWRLSINLVTYLVWERYRFISHQIVFPPIYKTNAIY